MLRLESSYLAWTSGLPGASTDFEIHAWIKTADSSGTQTLVFFSANFDLYVYLTGGNLHVYFGTGGDTDAGAVGTAPFYLAIVRTGSSLVVKRKPFGSSTFTTLATDAGFGTSAMTVFGFGADSGSNVVVDTSLDRVRMWSANLASDAARYKESHSRRAVVTTGLMMDMPLEKAAEFGTVLAGTMGNATATGTASLVTPGLVVVGTSVENGYLWSGGGPDEHAVGRSLGAIAATEAVARGFAIAPSTNTTSQRGLAIDGYNMFDHLSDSTGGGGLRAALIALANPSSVSFIQGGINDIWASGRTKEQLLTYFQGLTDEAHLYGSSVIAAAPTRVASGETGYAELNAFATLLLGDSAYYETTVDPGVPGTNYEIAGGDGIHPAGSPPGTAHYDGLAAWAKGVLNGHIVGVTLGAAPVLTSTDPADEETDVDPSTDVSLTYDGDIEAISGKNITLIAVVAPSSPTVPTTNTDAQNTNATAFVVDVPAVSTPAAGTATYVIIGLTKDANSVWSGTWPPTGWNVGVVSGQTSVYHAIIWRRYTSSASATTFSLTQSSDNASSRAWVVTGGHPSTDPAFGTPATASNTAPNPTSLAPVWSAEPKAAGYYVSIDGNITSYTHPTGWTANGGNATTTDGTTTNRVGQAYSHNTGVTGTIDAGALTITSGRWIATHWAVRPFDPSELIETIAADSGQVVITDDTAVITPTDPLPASSRIRVLADEGAFEAAGGSAPSAAIVAGMLEFLTGTGANGVAIGFGAPPAQFAATAAATASASAAFAAPHAVMAGQLSAIGSMAAGFVAPAAVLGMTLGIAAEAAVSVGFLAPPASLAAALAAEGSVGVGFSAPAAQLAAGLVAVASAAMGMSAPAAQLSALVGLEGAVTLGMTAAAPSMSATVGAVAGVSAGMSAPPARLDAALGAEASAAVGFVVPPSSFAATMGLRGSAALGFAAPPAELGMQVAHEGVSLVAIGFVAPPAAMAAALGAEAAAQLGFAAPAPSLGATVGAVAGASVGFAPPAARFDASLEAVPSGGFAVGFSAPSAVLAAALAAEGSVGVGFSVAPAALGMTAAVGVEVTLGFIVPAAALSITLDDPNGYVQAQFVVPAAVMAMAVIHANAFIPPATGETIGQFGADYQVGQFEADYQIGEFA